MTIFIQHILKYKIAFHMVVCSVGGGYSLFVNVLPVYLFLLSKWTDIVVDIRGDIWIYPILAAKTVPIFLRPFWEGKNRRKHHNFGDGSKVQNKKLFWMNTENRDRVQEF